MDNIRTTTTTRPKNDPRTIEDYLKQNLLHKYFERKTPEEAKAEILSDDFSVDALYPEDISQILIWMYDQRGNRTRKFKDTYNKFVDVLADKRGFRQFNYI